MKNLPKFLIFALGFLVILNIILFGIYFTKTSKFKLPFFLKKEKPTEQIALPTPLPSFASPVKKEHLATIPEYAADADHLVFFLPDETPVYAVFAGRVSRVVEDSTTPASDIPFDNIILKKEGEELTMSYLVFGETLIKEGDFVFEGEIIAKTKSGTGPGCLGGGNLGVYLFKDGKPARLTKEMLKTGKSLP